MKTGNQLFTLTLLGLLTFTASGCGAASGKYMNRSIASIPTTSTVTAPTIITTGTTGSTTPTTTAGTNAPQVYEVRGTGYTSATVTVTANHILKVKFAPETQDSAIAGTSTYPQYSMLGVFIQINGVTQDTGMLLNGLYGSQQTSTVLDFSSAVSSGCSTINASCHGQVTITITKPNNDYYCLNAGAYCPYTQVVAGHPWRGTLTVQTDDTTSL